MKLSIKQMGDDDRPREKFAAHGGTALSTAELLAILIGSGNGEENAVQLMQRIMHDCNGQLAALGRMSVGELCRYKGLGPAKAIALLAACELSRRRMSEHANTERLDSANKIYNYFKQKLSDTPVEECHVLLLNNNLKAIATKLISRGGITGTAVDVRLILREALFVNATHIVLCHNHPSGSLRPSRDDDNLTQKVDNAAQTMDIHLIDHLIFTNDGYYSYQEQGRL